MLMSNFYGVKKLSNKSVTNTSALGGWFMISGVDFGSNAPVKVVIQAASRKGGELEIWLDDLINGKRIAKVKVGATQAGISNLFTAALEKVQGQHDLFIRFPRGSAEDIQVKSIQFNAK